METTCNSSKKCGGNSNNNNIFSREIGEQRVPECEATFYLFLNLSSTILDKR